MQTEIQLYVFAVGFLCGTGAATILLLGGVGRFVVLAAAVLLMVAVVVAHSYGIDLALTITSTALKHPIDLNTLMVGCSTGKGLVGLSFPRVERGH